MNERDEVIADLRARYGSEVPIIDQLPDAREIVEKRSRLEFLAGALGYQRGMWKTWDGRILAIIVIPAVMSGYVTFWKPKIEAAFEYSAPYISSVQEAALQLTEDFIGFGTLPDPRVPIHAAGDRVAAALIPEILSPNLAHLTSASSDVPLILWRVQRRSYPAIDGRGTEIAGGRWTSPGKRALYTADSPLGAIDEVMFHLRRTAIDGGAPLDTSQFALYKIAASGPVQYVDGPHTTEPAARDWSDTRAIGDRWLTEGENAMLAYRSSFAPSGYNYILNLQHAALALRVLETHPIAGFST